MSASSRSRISAIVLAGGEGSRVGYRDKGLLPWKGRPLIDWVIDCIRPQTSDIVISANRHLEQYRMRGFAVISDTLPDFAGPLAGIAGGHAQVRGELVLTVPCDMPLLPPDLVSRLQQALEHGNADAAIAFDGSHTQYLVALYRNHVLKALPDVMNEGVRAVKHWLARVDHVIVDFSAEASCFGNFNTLDHV